jgi:hypothetical protein
VLALADRLDFFVGLGATVGMPTGSKEEMSKAAEETTTLSDWNRFPWSSASPGSTQTATTIAT